MNDVSRMRDGARRKAIDPVMLEVLRNALESVAEEAPVAQPG